MRKCFPVDFLRGGGERHKPASMPAAILWERGIDFSRVMMLASIFWVIIERQNSFLCSGFSRVSNCHFTRKGLAEYPDAPATQTISPFQLMRIKLTFCSASQDKTSKEMLPLPSNKIMRSGSATSPRK
jgi:hypothetical protein